MTDLRILDHTRDRHNALAISSVTPTEAHVAPSKTQRFRVLISGTQKAQKEGVKWTITGPGKINKDGVYSAPKAVSTSSPVTVVATSVADPSQAAQATMILTANPTPPVADKKQTRRGQRAIRLAVEATQQEPTSQRLETQLPLRHRQRMKQQELRRRLLRHLLLRPKSPVREAK